MEEKGKWIPMQVSFSILGNEIKYSEDPRAELFSAKWAGCPGLRTSFLGGRS